MLPDLPEPLKPLVDVGVRIARQAPSTSSAVAQLHGLLPPEVVPPEVRSRVMEVIAAAHAEAAVPLSGKDVEKALSSAWGSKPSKVLDDLDLGSPVAVTPSSQVHRGSLDGDDVAVKVRRPGLADGIRRDLSLLDTLSRPLGAAFPRLDAGALLREVRERVLDELDLEHEGSGQRRVARGVRRDPDLVVPSVHGEHTTEAVLVTDWLDGVSLADDPRPADAGRVARALVRLHLGAPTAVGLVLADPRPDDVLVLADGRVGVVDLGAAPADKARIGPALDVLEALRASDEDAFVRAVRTLGTTSEEDARVAFGLARDLAGDVLDGPVVGSAALLGRLAEDGARRFDEAFPLALRAEAHPPDLWALRGLGQLVATLSVLEVEEDWVPLAVAAGRNGWEV